MAARSFFCALCPYFLPVIEGEANVVLCIDGHVVCQAAPKAGLKIIHQLGFFQGAEKGFNLCPPGLLASDGFIKGFIPCLGGIKSGGQFIVAFLVFALVEGDMGVFVDAFFNKVGRSRHFSCQFILLGFEGGGIKSSVQGRRQRRNDFVFPGYQLIDG